MRFVAVSKRTRAAGLAFTLLAFASGCTSQSAVARDAGAGGAASEGGHDAAKPLGPVTLACADGGSMTFDPPAQFQPMVAEGVEWPLLFSLPQVTTASMDTKFLNMLEQAHVNTVSVIVWYSAYQAHQARYDAFVNAVHAAGLKLRLGFKGEIKSLLFGLTPTFPNAQTTFQEYSTKTLSIERELAARYHPDYFNMVEEFGTSQGQVGGNFTAAQWVQLVGQLATAIKQASSKTQTWVAVLPTDPVDRGVVAKGLLSIPNLDGVGIDAYGNQDVCTWAASWQKGFAGAAAAGKKTGFTETWWEDLFAQPMYDQPANGQKEGDWLRAMVYEAQKLGATGAFMPWFSEKFVTLQPDGFGQSNPMTHAQSLSNAVSAALDSGQRTVVFTELQATLAALPAGP